VIEKRIDAKLALVQSEGAYRQVAVPSATHDFASNDYLGFSRRSELIDAATRALAAQGCGGRSSPLIVGYTATHEALENRLATFLGAEAALVLNSGFSANHLLMTSLFERGDLLLHDRLNHASLLDGSVDSGAKVMRFAHNDVDALCKKLAKTSSTPGAVIVEGVYSMDGDEAPLEAILSACLRFDRPLIVDDAHGFGVLGDCGRGSLNAAGLLSGDVLAQVVTFGKAIGSFGAAIVGSTKLIDYLRNFGRGYIYSTALPAPQCAATMAALQLLESGDSVVEKLNANIRRFRSKANEAGIPIQLSYSAIQPVLVGSNHAVMNAHHALLKKGFKVGAVRAPTVPKGSERLRISLSAAHSEAQIDGLVNELKEVLNV